MDIDAIKFTTTEDILPVEQWEWNDFKATWEAIARDLGSDAAWKAIHTIWKLRAGECNVKNINLYILGNIPTNA